MKLARSVTGSFILAPYADTNAATGYVNQKLFSDNGGYKMDPSTLARKMLEWQNAKEKLDFLEGEIKAAVMELGQTQTVGSVRASYSKGVGRYDYELACRVTGLSERMLEPYEKVSYDWRQAVKDYKIDPKPFYAAGTPSVSVKLLA